MTTYRDYEIYPSERTAGPIAAGYFSYVHEEYDGPEDPRCGIAGSEEEAKELIDELEDE